jgi:hypothetical protein
LGYKDGYLCAEVCEMARRTGEKIGWIGGWIGAFLWVAILAVMFLVQGRVAAGAAGLGVVALAALLVALFAPWRHPTTALWKLLLLPYLAVAAAVAWTMLAWGVEALRAEGGSPWSLLLVLPILLPFFTAGRRRWNDGER